MRFTERWFWGIFLPLLALDQVTKEMAHRMLPPWESVEVIPGFFNLTYVKNTGIAFGLLRDSNNWLIVLALAVLTAAYFLTRHLDWRRREVNVIAGMFLAGGIGNLIDRLRFHFVVDFLDFHLGNHSWSHWPAFNVADSCICIGVAWIIYRELTGGMPATTLKT